MTNAKQAATQPEARFLKFIGPMSTLSRGRMKFEKDKTYKIIDNDDLCEDLLDTGRFRETGDPSRPKQRMRRSLHIQTGQRRTEPPAAAPERGDLSLDDLKKGGSADPTASEAKVEEVKDPDEPTVKLPSSPFTSKKAAKDWAKQNLDVDLDASRSLPELNRTIATAYGEKFGKKEEPDELDNDDVREENTVVEVVS
jgi:hypothetical protein